MCILKGGKTVCLTWNKVVPPSLDIWHGIGNITVLKYDFIKKPNYITLKSTSNPSIWRNGKWENLLILSSDGISAIANPQSIQMEHLVLNSHVLAHKSIFRYLFFKPSFFENLFAQSGLTCHSIENLLLAMLGQLGW